MVRTHCSSNGVVLIVRWKWHGGGGTQGVVDFAAVVRMLDILAKQGEQRRLQFLFELHDLDRDGYLNNNEMTDLMEKCAAQRLATVPGDKQRVHSPMPLAGGGRPGCGRAQLALAVRGRRQRRVPPRHFQPPQSWYGARNLARYHPILNAPKR